MPSWLEESVDLGDLLLGGHADARPEIVALDAEVEWQVLQPGMVDEVKKAIDIDAQKPFLVFSFHLYRHTGSFDDEGLVASMQTRWSSSAARSPASIRCSRWLPCPSSEAGHCCSQAWRGWRPGAAGGQSSLSQPTPDECAIQSRTSSATTPCSSSRAR
jgi:hypothetical protein